MAGQIYTIHSGSFTNSKGNIVPMKVVNVNGHSFIIVDEIDMFLQGNLSDINVGITAATGKQIVPLVSASGEDYELDVSNLGVPSLLKKP